MMRPPRSSPLFPSPPLFRSVPCGRRIRRETRSAALPPHRCARHEAPARRQTSIPSMLRRSRRTPRLWRRSRSEEHTSELQSPCNLVCRLLLEKKKTKLTPTHPSSMIFVQLSPPHTTPFFSSTQLCHTFFLSDLSSSTANHTLPILHDTRRHDI